MKLQDLAPLTVVFVVIAIVLAVGGDILEEIRDTQTENSTAYNVTGSGLEGLATFGDWLPTLAVIVVSAVVIGIVASYFMFRA